MKDILLAFAIVGTLTASNFFYQSLSGGLWRVAFERSFFQAVAVILTVWIVREYGGSHVG